MFMLYNCSYRHLLVCLVSDGLQIAKQEKGNEHAAEVLIVKQLLFGSVTMPSENTRNECNLALLELVRAFSPLSSILM